jgi:hypothetical protein
MIAFSTVSTFQIRLPLGELKLIIHIRDTLDCIQECTMPSIYIQLDLINNLDNPLVQLLSSENQNTVGQIIISLAQQFNHISNQSFDNVVSNLQEYLVKFLIKLQITTSNSIKLQSSSLVQLTKATNQSCIE